MNEWDSVEKKAGERQSVDDRLTAYYGPALGEQPLPSSSWQRLRSHLRSQRSPGRRFRRPRLWHLRRNRRRSSVPAFIEDTFARILYEARLPGTPAMLFCSIKFWAHEPSVRVFPLGRRNIKLSLPLEAAQSLEAPALDVLLATGLARYLSMRKAGYAAGRLLLGSVIPLACIALALLWLHHLPLFVLPIAIVLCCVLCGLALWLLHMQGRKMALQADSLLVQWLGRGRACQGLHALANRTRAPSRRRWSELSLKERIGHVCGTEVNIEHERLTLVR
jgi:hypothetical protein